MIACPAVASTKPSDRSLVERWAAGDRDAGSEFARRHFATLWTYFRNKLSEAPEDLIQATLVQCQRYRGRLGEADDVRAYLLSIARSQLRDHYRRVRPREDLDAMSVRDLASTLDTKLHRRHVQDTVARALQSLTLAHQEILELHYWNDLSVAEIAAVLEVPVGTVKSRLIRAREALRAHLPETHAPDLDVSLRSARPTDA